MSGVSRAAFLTLAFLLTACGSPDPDPLHALVVAPEGPLRDAAAEGAAMWHEATAGRVAFTLADRCSGPAFCITVTAADALEGGDACGATARWTSDDTAGAFVRVTHDGVTAVTMAHEFGHALGLGHVDSEGELMYPTAGTGAAFGPATMAAFKAEFGGRI